METGSLVMDSLLKLTRQSDNGRNSVLSLGEQRRFAEVASDLARSPAFTSVLLQTGRLESFLHAAVIAITRAAEEIDILEAGMLERNGAMGAAQRRLGGSDGVMTPPEALLRALTSFCLEHSPARSAFVGAFFSSNSVERRNANTQASAPGHPEGAADFIRRRGSNPDSGGDGDHSEIGFEPLTAIFVLCLHPHLPTATAASALLQCLLVGGGALGAVSGPSPGAVAGVGVIPAAYFTVGAIVGGVGTGRDIGREDPLQGKLLERLNVVAIGGRRAGACVNRGLRYGNRKPRSFSGQESFPTTGSISEHQGSSDRNANNVSPHGRKAEREQSRCASSGSESDFGEDESSAGDELVCSGLAAGVACLTLNNNPHSSSGVSGLSAATVTTGGGGDPRMSPSLSSPGAAVELILRRLAKIGSELAAAWAKEQLASGAVGDAGIGAAEGQKRVTFAGRGGGERLGDGGREPALFRGCSVEVEQNVTSLLCLLSSLVSEYVSRCSLIGIAMKWTGRDGTMRVEFSRNILLAKKDWAKVIRCVVFSLRWPLKFCDGRITPTFVRSCSSPRSARCQESVELRPSTPPQSCLVFRCYTAVNHAIRLISRALVMQWCFLSLRHALRETTAKNKIYISRKKCKGSGEPRVRVRSRACRRSARVSSCAYPFGTTKRAQRLKPGGLPKSSCRDSPRGANSDRSTSPGPKPSVP